MRCFSKKLWLGVVGLVMVSSVFAKNDALSTRLVFDHMKVVKASEHDGDELYFDVSVYQLNQPTQYIRIPEKPMHWLSQLLAKNTPVTLWTGSVSPKHPVTLVVSLMDADMSKMNPDDVIGSMRVELKNHDGKLVAYWSLPNRHDAPVMTSSIKENTHEFALITSKNGTYEVYFSLK